MVNEDAKMIRFVPGVERGIFSDPSYHLPAFYELWARWGPPADRAFWAAAADTSRVFFQRATNPRTGLAPDYANFDGTPFVSGRNSHSANFSFDSWRTASNWRACRHQCRSQPCSGRYRIYPSGQPVYR
ncbi:MAG TPA: glycosyl hydrolase family 8 [Puia sp.]|nr:glycosyl hydrolase family 8 [Puia sp.]